MRFLTLGIVLSVAVSAAPVSPGHGHGNGPWWHQNAAKAVYFLDDDPSGSSIVSLHVGNDQLLSNPVRTSTNGFGAIGVNGTGFPNPADALMSQDAVVVSGDVGFSVHNLAASIRHARQRSDPQGFAGEKIDGVR